ncbi:MAG: putative deoxyribonuclease TatD family protein [Chlamydiales bacterium]|jgi:TatD DNase family protein|nr:putative deoxyribonuclease TatD family protein [Chlamydiales bacterium]
MLFDSHTHISSEDMFKECQTLFPEEANPIDSLIREGQAMGVSAMINICTEQDSLERGFELQERFPFLFNAAASTPNSVEEEDAFFKEVKAHAKKLVAIGETGLDYHYTYVAKEVQQRSFYRYLALAEEEKLPVVIHCRDAFADFFAIIDEVKPALPGILHCFTGSLQEAEGVLERGWFLSLSGIATFKKSQELRQVAKMAPLDQLLIETDAPFLAPQKYRGKMNRPAYLIEMLHMLAQEKERPIEAIAPQIFNNTLKAFPRVCLDKR